MAQSPVVIWKKRILIPFWVVRICLTLFIIAAYGWAIKRANDDDQLRTPRVGSVVVFMLFLVAVLLIDVLAILLFLRDALKPGTFLTMNSFQTGFWTGSLIMDIVYVARGKSAVALGFSIFVLFTYVALLVYAIVKYRRQKKEAQRGNYAPALNPLAPPAPGYHPPAYMNAAPYQHQGTGFNQNTSYVPPASKPFDSHNQGAAANYYNEAPAKPAQMV